jgi:outer membrane protein assembly factor BamB
MPASPYLWIAILASAVAAQEWPRFRGPNGSGVLEVDSLPATFGPAQNVAWQQRVPYAASSPVLGAGCVFLTTSVDDDLVVLCLARADGAERWQRRLRRARQVERHENNDPAAATPVTDGARVFAFFPELGVVAFDSAGKQLWLRPLGPFNNRYGMAASPILIGETLVLLCDQEFGSYLLALDVTTGDVKWQRAREAMSASWTTPVLYPADAAAAKTQILTFGNFAAHGYRLATGDPQWQAIGLGVCPVSSPVVAGDRLFVCAPFPAEIPAPNFAELVAAYDSDKDGKLAKTEFGNPVFATHFARIDTNSDEFIDDGEWEKSKMALGSEDYGLVAYDLSQPLHDGSRTEAWRVKKGLAMVSTPIVYRDVLYMVKDGGIMSSIDPASGEVYRCERLGDAIGTFFPSPVAAGGRILFPSNPGKIAIVAAGKQWRLLEVVDFGEEIRATPAIGADGALFVRTATKLYCCKKPP